MNASNPLVTVYIPTYNRVDLLKRAVESVLQQTYKNLEVIIVDDCSTDGTHAYLLEIVQKDKRVHYFIKENNSGACVSRNIAINNAHGEFITGLDDDDYFLESRVQNLINFYYNSGEDFLCTAFLIKNKYNLLKSNGYEGLITFDMMKNKNMVDNQIFARKKYFEMMNGFDEKAPAWQDYDLWFRMIENVKPCYRLADYTYVKDISHEKSRITMSSKAYQGYLYFIEKHNSKLTKKNMQSLYLIDLINRGQKIKISHLLKNFSMTSFLIFLKSNIPNFLKKAIRK